MGKFRVFHVAVLVSVFVLSACGTTAAIKPTATADVVQVTETATPPVSTATALVTELPATETVIAAPAGKAPGMGLNPAPLAAVQTIVDYYTAINAQQYPVAYKFWNNPSQTLAQITSVFTGTVESRVRIGDPDVAVDMVMLPVTITAVVNQANGDQKVLYFAGTYTVQNNLITNTTIVEVPAPASSDDTDPAGLIANYFAEINALKFGSAYTLWDHNGADSQMPYAAFVPSLTAVLGAGVTTGKVQEEGAMGSSYATVPTVNVTPKQMVRCKYSVAHIRCGM